MSDELEGETPPAEEGRAEESLAEASAPKKRKKKKRRPLVDLPPYPTESPKVTLAEPVATPGPQAGSKGFALLLAVLSLGVSVWRLTRCGAGSSSSSSGASFKLNPPEPEPQNQAPQDPYLCGVACMKGCVGDPDATMRLMCPRMCKQTCPVPANAPTPRTGIPECDSYLSAWAKCQPGAKADLYQMAWQVGATDELNHDETVATCVEVGKDLARVCDPSFRPASSTASAMSATPSSKPRSAASTNVRPPVESSAHGAGPK